MFARAIWRLCKIQRASNARPYSPAQSLPCVKGDSPQCGEMSRSDRGARRVSGWHGVSRDGGIVTLRYRPTCPASGTIPQSPSVTAPFTQGSLCPTLFVGGGVLDAPRVCVVVRLRFGSCSCRFVGRGLDPSTGGNGGPVRGVGDAAPYIQFLCLQ